MKSRHLSWEGCFNVRDLGGLPAGDRFTIFRRVVRGDAPDVLTDEGWGDLVDHGIRTIVDLRNPEELPLELPRPPNGVTRVHVPLDDSEDKDFWEFCWNNELDGSPLYYDPFLRRKSDRVAAVLRVIAQADGGVFVHCVGGRDRTGLIALLLLALVDAPTAEIADDYELSTARLRAMYHSLGEDDQGVEIAEILERKGTSPRASIFELLDSLDVHSYLSTAGLSEQELAALRSRLVGKAFMLSPF